MSATRLGIAGVALFVAGLVVAVWTTGDLLVGERACYSLLIVGFTLGCAAGFKSVDEL